MLKICIKTLVTIAIAIAAPSLVSAQTEAPPPLSVYGELPLVEDAAISNSGLYIAFLARIRGERTVLVLNKELKPVTTFAVGEAKIRSIRFVGDESILMVKSTTEDLQQRFVLDKLEVFRGLILPLDSAREPFYIFSDQRDIENGLFGSYGFRQTNNGWVGYFGGLELTRDAGSSRQRLVSGRPALFEVNLRTNKAKRVIRSGREGMNDDWLIGVDGKPAATFEIGRKNGEWSIENADGKELATGTNTKGGAYIVGLGKDGNTLIYSSNDPLNERTRWFEVPLDGDASAKEVLDDVSIGGAYFDRTNGKMIGYRRGGGSSRSVFFDPEMEKAAGSLRRAFPKVRMRMADWTSDFRYVLVRTSGNGDSGSWFVVNVAQLEAKFIAAERPSIGANQVGPISKFEYSAADGLEMDGILNLPPGREPQNLPAIMLPHGGPNSHDTTSFDWMAQAFASRGYAVFQPNFRGSTNRGGSFRRASYGQWGRKMQTDISDGLEELVKIGIIDPDRVCILGASYGGYAALAGVTLQNGIYKCAVAIAPVSDLKMLKISEVRESGRSRLLDRALDEELGPEGEFESFSPRKQAERADAPILLIHGKDDTVVLFEQSDKMADALDDADKPHRFIALDGEDHWLSRSQTRKQTLAAAMQFVREHNPAD